METPNEVERKQTKDFVTKEQKVESETGKDADPMRKDALEQRDAKPGDETKDCQYNCRHFGFKTKE